MTQLEYSWQIQVDMEGGGRFQSKNIGTPNNNSQHLLSPSYKKYYLLTHLQTPPPCISEPSDNFPHIPTTSPNYPQRPIESSPVSASP